MIQLDLLVPFFTASILLALIGLLIPHWIKWIGIIAFGFMLSGTLTLFYLVINSFTGEGINEAVIVHSLYGYNELKIGQFKELILVSILSLAFIIFLSLQFIRIAKTKASQKQQEKPRILKIAVNTFGYLLMFFSIAAHPAVIDTIDLYNKYSSALSSKSKEQFKQYFKPIDVEIDKSKKTKNIVYIYAESLENSFFNESIFPGLITHLRTLKQKSISFENIHQIQLTDWTIAGMTATQCGVPLSTFRRKNVIEEKDRFLPGQSCLGDILTHAGYHLTYMGGADKSFAGKGRFYQEHKFNEVLGLNDHLKELPKGTNTSKWGIFDDDLFSLVFAKYQHLLAQKQPFALLTLTLDTHPPHGHKTSACKNITYADGENPMLNAIACSDFLITDLVKRMQSLPGSENTLFVIGSDHLMMRSSASELLQRMENNRRNLLMVLNADIPSGVNNIAASSLDVGPTILSLAGFQTNEFSLGRNMLGSSPPLTSVLGFQKFDQQIYDWRVNLFSSSSTNSLR